MEPPLLAIDIPAEVDPEARGLDQDLGAVLAQESLVAGRLDVLADGVGDIGIDVILGSPGRVVRRRFVTIYRPPGESGAPCPSSRARARALSSWS